MEKGYEDLFIAIWTSAISSDIANAEKRLFEYAFNSVYEEYSLNEAEPLEKK